MLKFSDRPYQFFPPRYFAPTAWVIRQMNRRWLRTKLRIAQLDVVGAEHLRQLPRGARLVLMPNHPTHCDASILFEACRRLRIRPRVMAAYDVYHRGPLDGWVMRRVGCFSVDREGSDKPALEEAGRTILGGRFALTLFPEGNVYLENDRVTPFHDGAALLAVRAAKQLAEREPDAHVLAVPISIKATHLTDCRAALRDVFHAAARDVGVTLHAGQRPLEALRAIGLAAMRRQLASQGITVGADATDVRTLTRAAAADVLGKLEPLLGITARPGDDAMDRVRAARRVVHEIRIDPTQSARHAEAAVWAEQAMLAFRLASYSGDYVAERPSLDRIGETLEKLYEDTHDRFLSPYADRAAVVRIAEPIDVTAMLTAGTKQKQLIHALSERVEAACQAGVDAINRDNRHPGKGLWTDPIG